MAKRTTKTNKGKERKQKQKNNRITKNKWKIEENRKYNDKEN